MRCQGQEFRLKEGFMIRYVTILILIASFFIGCSPAITVRVDSIVDYGQKPDKKTYVLFSGMKEVSADDLYFREYGRYFRTILKRQGYSEAENAKNADVAIYFFYGIDRGRDIHYTVARPIYAFEGGESIDYTETQTDPSGKTTRTKGSVYIPPRDRVVAVVTERKSYTVYTAFAILEAKEIEHGKEPKDLKTLWKATITTTGKIDDLRRLMPIMAAASAPYLGTDTGRLATIKLRENDERVVEMRLLRR